MREARAFTATCEIGSCDDHASGVVTDYDGNDRNYCDKHTRQMGNLAGWSRKEARTASLLSQFVQWCSMSGMDPHDPGSLSGFSAATGIDQQAILPLLQQVGAPGGGGAMPSIPGPPHGGDDLSGLDDRDLTLSN